MKHEMLRCVTFLQNYCICMCQALLSIPLPPHLSNRRSTKFTSIRPSLRCVKIFNRTMAEINMIVSTKRISDFEFLKIETWKLFWIGGRLEVRLYIVLYNSRFTFRITLPSLRTMIRPHRKNSDHSNNKQLFPVEMSIVPHRMVLNRWIIS